MKGMLLYSSTAKPQTMLEMACGTKAFMPRRSASRAIVSSSWSSERDRVAIAHTTLLISCSCHVSTCVCAPAHASQYCHACTPPMLTGRISSTSQSARLWRCPKSSCHIRTQACEMHTDVLVNHKVCWAHVSCNRYASNIGMHAKMC